MLNAVTCDYSVETHFFYFFFAADLDSRQGGEKAESIFRFQQHGFTGRNRCCLFTPCAHLSVLRVAGCQPQPLKSP